MKKTVKWKKVHGGTKHGQPLARWINKEWMQPLGQQEPAMKPAVQLLSNILDTVWPVDPAGGVTKQGV